MKNYQTNYASSRPHMYDNSSREKKALRIVKTLAHFYQNKKLSELTLLDIGSSTGIIDNFLSNYFKTVVGTDIDKEAVFYARKNFKKINLRFEIEDALNLSFPTNCFDVIVCAQVYEHVPNPRRLMDEIFRVLKPGGVCYFAAINKLWPIEAHYNLPFLSYLPKNRADLYIRLTNKGASYYETPMSYWELTKLTKNFKKVEYTSKIIRNPTIFGYGEIFFKPIYSLLSIPFGIIGKYFAPTLFWILIKPPRTNL